MTNYNSSNIAVSSQLGEFIAIYAIAPNFMRQFFLAYFLKSRFAKKNPDGR